MRDVSEAHIIYVCMYMGLLYNNHNKSVTEKWRIYIKAQGIAQLKTGLHTYLRLFISSFVVVVHKHVKKQK